MLSARVSEPQALFSPAARSVSPQITHSSDQASLGSQEGLPADYSLGRGQSVLARQPGGSGLGGSRCLGGHGWVSKNASAGPQQTSCARAGGSAASLPSAALPARYADAFSFILEGDTRKRRVSRPGETSHNIRLRVTKTHPTPCCHQCTCAAWRYLRRR